jgi:hypothetical protein
VQLVTFLLNEFFLQINIEREVSILSCSTISYETFIVGDEFFFLKEFAVSFRFSNE